MTTTDDQLVAEEDEQHGREEVETDLIQYLRDKLVQFYGKISSYSTNVATARGIQKLSSEFEILVFGPARVGKSTLIKQVSGDETIPGRNCVIVSCRELYILISIRLTDPTGNL